MLVAVVLICSAGILYTLAIWSERIAKGLKKWMVAVFGCAVICDLIGTGIMGVQPTAGQLNPHTFLGYAALVIMIAHFLWAMAALVGHEKSIQYFRRFSIYAWLIWLLAFSTGAFLR